MCAVLSICTESMDCPTRERCGVWIHRKQSYKEKSEDFLRLNPKGIVPVLEVNVQSVFESGVCIEFIDEYGGATNRLLPLDPLARAKTRIVCGCISREIISAFYGLLLKQDAIPKRKSNQHCYRIWKCLWPTNRILFLFSVVTKWVGQISCWYHLPLDSQFCLIIEALKYQRKKTIRIFRQGWKRVKNSSQSSILLAILIKPLWFTSHSRMHPRTLEARSNKFINHLPKLIIHVLFFFKG